ncbi:MAG TPA: response regulator [Nitrospira sp.]|nr:response regulator [Nitrospira sp.]
MRHESPRILLADDEDTFRLSTAKLLEQEGYRCDCAQDSEEASRLLTSQHDVLLSDIRMPGNMQFEFLHDIRRRFPSLPIVLVTGYPSVQTAVEALRLSFTDYLLKPVDWLDLLRAVKQASEKSRILRMTDVAQDETDRVGTALDHVRELLSRPGTMANERELTWSIEAFLSQSVGQMATLATGIRAVMANPSTAPTKATADVCRVLDCPRRVAYREALEGTVEVLEKTKFAFRSKELGLLRRKIEDLLKADGLGESGSLRMEDGTED